MSLKLRVVEVIELFSVEAVQECDYALLAVSGGFSTEFSPQIISNGKTCADASAETREAPGAA